MRKNLFDYLRFSVDHNSMELVRKPDSCTVIARSKLIVEGYSDLASTLPDFQEKRSH